MIREYRGAIASRRALSSNARRASAGEVGTGRARGRWRWLYAPAVLLFLLGVGAPISAAQAQRNPASARSDVSDRASLERQLQERLFARVQRALRLTPQQAQRLRAVSHRTDERFGPILRRERELRHQLRAELERDKRADDAKVAQLLDGLFAAQRDRLEVAQAEQRELALFLSPVQRARYLSIQENLHRRVSELEDRDRKDGSRRSRRPSDRERHDP